MCKYILSNYIVCYHLLMFAFLYLILTSVLGWESKGCYKDSGVRALDGFYTNGVGYTMTVDECVRRCRETVSMG